MGDSPCPGRRAGMVASPSHSWGWSSHSATETGGVTDLQGSCRYISSFRWYGQEALRTSISVAENGWGDRCVGLVAGGGAVKLQHAVRLMVDGWGRHASRSWVLPGEVALRCGFWATL